MLTAFNGFIKLTVGLTDHNDPIEVVFLLWLLISSSFCGICCCLFSVVVFRPVRR